MQVETKKPMTKRQREIAAAAAKCGWRVSDVVRTIVEEEQVNSSTVYRSIKGTVKSPRIETALMRVLKMKTLPKGVSA